MNDKKNKNWVHSHWDKKKKEKKEETRKVVRRKQHMDNWNKLKFNTKFDYEYMFKYLLIAVEKHSKKIYCIYKIIYQVGENS